MTLISILKRELRCKFQAASWTAWDTTTRVHFISFTASSPLGFVVHPYSYPRIKQQRAERNRIVTAHKFSFLTFAKVFLDRWDVYGFGQKDIFGESSSCLLVLCETCVKEKLSFGNSTEPGHFPYIRAVVSASRASTCVDMWGSTCGFIFLVMKHSEWILK
jgi:hypothetical protein